MLVLGIETSCDETSAAVLRASETAPDARETPTRAPMILSNIVLSQDEIHAPYGGVVPELASRQHIRTIGAVVGESLSRAGVGLEKIDLYAVTQGPGLIGSLLVGLSFGKSLAYYFKKPLVGVDHLAAHLEAGLSRESRRSRSPPSAFSFPAATRPFISWTVRSLRGSWAGPATTRPAKPWTRWPSSSTSDIRGGPSSSGWPAAGTPRIPLRRAPDQGRSLDFSFSGLKTAALRHIRENGISKDSPALADFLASFEEIVARSLLDNVRQAAEETQPRSLILCGGVARNTRLRTRFQEFAREADLDAFIPSPKLCTDNAAMVAAVALRKFARQPAAAPDLDLDAYPR